MAIEYYLLDTETTGLKNSYHEINQISIIRVSDGVQCTVNIAVDYPRRSNPEALKIQNKTYRDLLQGVPKSEAVARVDQFMLGDGKTTEHRCIVAYNAAFDRRFCHATWASLSKQFPADLWLCAMAFGKKYAKRIGPEKIAQAQNLPKPKFSLDLFMQAVGLPVKYGSHSATIDTQNTLVLFNFLMAQKLDYVGLIKREPHRIITEHTDFDAI
jgi:DNA polymerase III epsilon subunit-like protein